MTLLLALVCIYTGHIVFRVIATKIKRKSLKVGDMCRIYIGEQKIQGLVIKINHDIDVWVSDKVIRAERNQIYI
jgi:hypothetical protein